MAMTINPGARVRVTEIAAPWHGAEGLVLNPSPIPGSIVGPDTYIVQLDGFPVPVSFRSHELVFA